MTIQAATTRTTARARKRRYLAPLLLSLAAAAVAAPALADDHRHHGPGKHHADRYDRDRDDRRWDRDDQRRWERDRRDWQREQARRYEQQRRWEAQRQREYYRHAYQPRPVVVVPRPVRYAGPPAWVRGRDYRSYGYGNVYYVPYNDYGRYDLYSPAYGQRWVRDDRGNFLLVAAATGIIASILTR